VIRQLAHSFIAAGMLLGFPVTVPAQALPERAYISGLVGYSQRFTLSCESRSAVDWAAYWGASIREKKFLNSLPRTDNPDTGFVGNPSGEWGDLPPGSYGVHAEPVAALLREYGLQAEAHRGLSWDDLRSEVAAGRPVIVWVIGQMWSGNPVSYTASDGHTTTVARFEHTMILVGYDPTRVHVVDAFSGRTLIYPVKRFLTSWKVLGNMGIVGGGLVAPISTPAPASENALPAPVEAGALSNLSYFPIAYKASGTAGVGTAPVSIPPTYTVKRGEYLVEIARRYALDWQYLAQMNGIPYPFVIRTGQVLQLR
jgi:uncharacterized protein YvpB/LysM repeat protein